MVCQLKLVYEHLIELTDYVKVAISDEFNYLSSLFAGCSPRAVASQHLNVLITEVIQPKVAFDIDLSRILEAKSHRKEVSHRRSHKVIVLLLRAVFELLIFIITNDEVGWVNLIVELLVPLHNPELNVVVVEWIKYLIPLG